MIGSIDHVIRHADHVIRSCGHVLSIQSRLPVGFECCGLGRSTGRH